ncbi:BamA/TamA family outer membrane protein [Pelagicoccus sp. SDUM812003]|uniref:BamA/OMP85 family outer membrane protein n=1 Tax=Pelagicoccus sp. SDUM812003 TaxID=3041267 RepID=UPI00280E70DE|nr:BamA/TamA family outer membrane protein [Pelagicoccus sp. SDUM812003]MDQ8205213.1 BamA/TamA family outer membrane protein [Pelagicoccus sp. SDUM812003]
MDVFQKIGRNLICLSFAVVFTALSQAKLVSVDGFGLFGSAELRNALRLLEMEGDTISGRQIDDGAFLIITRLKQSGYLDARLSAEIKLDEERSITASWSTDFEPQLDPDLTASSASYTVEAGTLHYYEEVEITGLHSIPIDEARTYFVPDDTLYSRKKDRAYSPSLLSSQQKQLIGALSALGKADARVAEQTVDIDSETGQVFVQLTIDEGPLYRITEQVISIDTESSPAEESSIPTDAIYSKIWIENRLRALRNESYQLGYPDTRISHSNSEVTNKGDTIELVVRFDIQRGSKVILTDVKHLGADDTKTSLLERKTDLVVGEPLDITEVEAARRRLSSLGIFKRIDLEYEEVGDNGRQAIFNYEKGLRLEWQLLLGYGSYEGLRGGVLAKRSNFFGRAHSLNFQAVQSIKSTHGRVNYTMPELLGEFIDVRVEADYLDREELYFDRTERGVSAGVSTHLNNYGIDLGLDYAFERKRSSDPRFNADLRLEDTNIGSISVRATKNELDNILYPTSGYEISSSFRYASEELGGETEFIRPEVGASFHHRIDSRWILHLSGKLGYTSSPDENVVAIPYGERFLVGGENSLRGFRRGEAGPVDSEGIPIGAEAVALFNAELEYPLFNRINAVVFFDTARVWDSTGDLDTFEDFANVGIGVRYKTIVGPVRLEYGHNIDPRPSDPEGTVHLSIGFPF